MLFLVVCVVYVSLLALCVFGDSCDHFNVFGWAEGYCFSNDTSHVFRCDGSTGYIDQYDDLNCAVGKKTVQAPFHYECDSGDNSCGIIKMTITEHDSEDCSTTILSTSIKYYVDYVDCVYDGGHEYYSVSASSNNYSRVHYSDSDCTNEISSVYIDDGDCIYMQSQGSNYGRSFEYTLEDLTQSHA